MSVRGLLVLVVVLAGIVAWIVWVERPGEQGETPAAAALVTGLEPEAVSAVELERDGAVVRLERDGSGGWRVTAPFDVEADPERVERLLEAVALARVERVVSERADDLAPYGLEPPDAELRLTAPGSTYTIRLGSAPPVGSGRYVTDGTSRVVLAGAGLADVLRADAADFRERRLVPLRAEHVRAVAVERGRSSVALERRGSEWSLVAPLADRADFAAADALARAVTRMRVLGPPDEPPPAGAFADAVAVTVETPERSVRIELGGPAGEDARWARRADGSLAGAVPEEEAEALERGPDELRERQLAFFSRSDVLELRLSGGPSPVVVHREAPGRPWSAAGEGGELDGERVEQLLDEIRWLRATTFGDDGASAGAAREIAVAGASGELGALRVERLDAAGDVPTFRVRSSWRPGFVFGVRSEALAALPASAGELRPGAPEGPAP